MSRSCKVKTALSMLCFAVGCAPQCEPMFCRSHEYEKRRVANRLESLDSRYVFYRTKPCGADFKITTYKMLSGNENESHKTIVHKNNTMIKETDIFWSGRWLPCKIDGPVSERIWHTYVYDLDLAKEAKAYVLHDGNSYFYEGTNVVGDASIVEISREEFLRYLSEWSKNRQDTCVGERQ